VNGVLRIALVNPVNADVTGQSALLFQNLPAATASVLSPLGASWRYLDDGSNQGTAWRGTNFNDSSWSNGVARIGFGPDAAPLGTTIRRYLSGNSGPQPTNYYFRRAIVVTNPGDYTGLQFRYQRDDGCVVYLNGTPVVTNNMPAGEPISVTQAASTISGATALLTFWTNAVPASLLQPGTNIIAVEVHQVSATSSDIAWDLEIQGTGAPRVNLVHFGNDAVLYWNDATFGLEEADVVTGPWRPAVPATSPSASGISSNRFFRLRK
jgi:hypothetical protein